MLAESAKRPCYFAWTKGFFISCMSVLVTQRLPVGQPSNHLLMLCEWSRRARELRPRLKCYSLAWVRSFYDVAKVKVCPRSAFGLAVLLFTARSSIQELLMNLVNDCIISYEPIASG